MASTWSISASTPATVMHPAGWTADAPHFDGNDLKINITSIGGIVSDPYLAWAGSSLFAADVNNDGISNGLAFMLDAASPSANAVGLLPVVTQNTGGLAISFTMRNAANRGTTTLNVQHSSDLDLSDTWASAAIPETSGTADGVTCPTPEKSYPTLEESCPTPEESCPTPEESCPAVQELGKDSHHTGRNLEVSGR